MDNIKGLLKDAKPKRDGDLIDRFNYAYTVIILIVFAFFIALWSFFGRPLQCWYPPYFKGWWVQYANDYCYVSSTYYHPFLNQPGLPQNFDHEQSMYNEPALRDYYSQPEISFFSNNSTFKLAGEKRVLPYYQWTYVILALMGVLFYVPAVLWRNMNNASGMFVNSILETSTSAENMDAKTRKEKMKKVAKYLDYSFQIHEKIRKRNKYPSGFHGCYITTLYVFVKFLYFFNAVCQFIILNKFVGTDNFSFGAKVLSDLISGESWIISQRFPRVTLCEFAVRVLGVLQHHKVQCVLILNMFNEKFFLFLWWWFIFLIAINAMSLFYWIFIAVYYTFKGDFAQTMMPNAVMSRKNPKIKSGVNDFLRNYIHTDGIFMLKLISINSGDLVSRELLMCCWENYLSHHPFVHEQMRQPSVPGYATKPTAPPGSPVTMVSPKKNGNFNMLKPSSPPPSYGEFNEHDPNDGVMKTTEI